MHPPPPLPPPRRRCSRCGQAHLTHTAGGFTATLTVNGQDNLDDIIRWQPEAVINTRSLVSPAGGDS